MDFTIQKTSERLTPLARSRDVRNVNVHGLSQDQRCPSEVQEGVQQLRRGWNTYRQKPTPQNTELWLITAGFILYSQKMLGSEAFSAVRSAHTWQEHCSAVLPALTSSAQPSGDDVLGASAFYIGKCGVEKEVASMTSTDWAAWVFCSPVWRLKNYP